MRDQFAPVIEGFHCDGITNPWSFQSESFYEDGGNGGTMMDGTTVQDVLAVKNRFSWALNVLTMSQYNALIAALDSGSEPDTVSAIVYDPATDTRYSTAFHVTPPVFRFVPDISGATVAIPDSPLVLEETGEGKTISHIIASDDDWTLYDDGTLEIDPLPDGSPETEGDRWTRILEDLDNPSGSPDNLIHDVDRIKLNPNIPSLPSGIPERFPNLDEIVIPPNVEIPPDEFDNCPGLTIIKIVSFPYKSDYITGNTLDYNGLHVVEISSNTERDITSECVLLPAEGTEVTEAGDIMVDVRYQDKSLGTFWVAVAEAEIIDGGDWWTLYDSGLLDIYYNGDMPDYTATSSNSPPWYSSKENITNVTIRNSVTSIGDCAFYNCTGLTSVTIPDSVTSIGQSAFSDCTSLASVTIPDSVTSIGSGTFQFCKNLANVTIPDGVTSIGEWAFFRCTGLASITIPDGVTSIEGYTFSGCTSLTSITIPDSVTSIGQSAFSVCASLTSITIPDGVTSIGQSAFSDCASLASVTIPDSVTSIGQLAFDGCTDLTNVTIPVSVTSIGQYAFYECTSLTSVTIPSSVASIESGTFHSCSNLSSITIPSSVTSIESAAFYKCTSLASVTIPGNVTSIGSSAFRYCSNLTSVTILRNVTSIGSGAFENCYKLTSITIPASVTSIGNFAFYDSHLLADVYYGGTETQWNAITIGSNNAPLLNATIHYNSASPT